MLNQKTPYILHVRPTINVQSTRSDNEPRQEVDDRPYFSCGTAGLSIKWHCVRNFIRGRRPQAGCPTQSDCSTLVAVIK